MRREERVLMTAREGKRVYLVQQVIARQVRQRQAATLLQCSVRQLRRWIERVRTEGPPGLVHRLRGRPSNRRAPDRIRDRVLRVWRLRYQGFGPTFTQEKLRAHERIRVGRETIRRWLLAAGLWPRQRQARDPHVWRARKACAGELVQMDGSHHAWLEDRGPRLVLMAYIDDATSAVFARFYDYEGTWPALDSFARYIRCYGVPQALYADRHTTYRSPGKRTLEDELAGRARPQSQFERAVAELGVTLIPAYSPQAKGRVERLFRTLQDRLVKELRLAGVATRNAANRLLEAYLPRHNRQFRRAPANANNLHRPAPPVARVQQALTIRQTHVLRADSTLRHANRLLLVHGPWGRRRPTTLAVEERLNGRRYVLEGDRILRYREVQERPPARQVVPRSSVPRAVRRLPAADHPWRRRRCLPPQNRTVLLSEKEDISIGR